jgi:hypothetical protein
MAVLIFVLYASFLEGGVLDPVVGMGLVVRVHRAGPDAFLRLAVQVPVRGPATALAGSGRAAGGQRRGGRYSGGQAEEGTSGERHVFSPHSRAAGFS